MIAGVPYDAEIEYLGSSGLQHIDTNLIAASGWKIDITFASTSWTDTAMSLFGSRTSSTSNDAFSAFTASTGLFPQYDGQQSQIPNTANILNRKYRLVMGAEGVFLDGVMIRSANTNTFVTPGTTYLFKKNQNDAGGDRPFYGRIYQCHIWNSLNKLVGYFIPVRVGFVGYMYDRVTRKFFGNAGTGSFVLGPDVATPVMGLRRYPQIGGAA